MRNTWVALLILLAACGGAPKSQETAEPALTKSAGVLWAEHLANEVCACPDRTCARAAIEREVEHMKQMNLPEPSDHEKRALESTQARTQACFDALPAPAATGATTTSKEIVATVEHMADEVCACPDAACAEAAARRAQDYLAQLQNAEKPNDADVEAVGKAGRRAGECMGKLRANH